jgi:hypothetical protein
MFEIISITAAETTSTVPTFAKQLKHPFLSLPAFRQWRQDSAPGGATVRNFVIGTVVLLCY